MPGPNFDNYSLEELHQALSTIDEGRFPERVALIREKIAEYKAHPVEIEDSADSHEGSKTSSLDLERYLLLYRKGANLLYIVSFLLGISYLLDLLNLLRLREFAYYVQFSFPGSKNVGTESAKVLFYVVILVINGGFLAGSIGSYLGSRTFRLILAICWGLMALGVEFWRFTWWPTLYFDFDFSFSFDLFGLALGFKINFIAAFLFGWAMALSPDMRAEIEESSR